MTETGFPHLPDGGGEGDQEAAPALRRMKRRIRHFKKEFTQGKMLDGEQVRRCLVSWCGHARHGDTYNLRRKLFGKLILRRSRE